MGKRFVTSITGCAPPTSFAFSHAAPRVAASTTNAFCFQCSGTSDSSKTLTPHIRATMKSSTYSGLWPRGLSGLTSHRL
jgi:hypothetical protein